MNDRGTNGAHVQHARLRAAVGLGAYARLLALWAEIGGVTEVEMRAERAAHERGANLRDWHRRRREQQEQQA